MSHLLMFCRKEGKCESEMTKWLEKCELIKNQKEGECIEWTVVMGTKLSEKVKKTTVHLKPSPGSLCRTGVTALG